MGVAASSPEAAEAAAPDITGSSGGGNASGGAPALPEAAWVRIVGAIRHVEAVGLLEEGVYRVTGLGADVQRAALFLSSGQGALSHADLGINEWAGGIKMCLRRFEPLAPYTAFSALLACADGSATDSASALRDVLSSLPPRCYTRLRFACGHLGRVAAASAVNLMTASNLAKLWGGILARPDEAPATSLAAELRLAHDQYRVGSMLIEHFIADGAAAEGAADPWNGDYEDEEKRGGGPAAGPGTQQQQHRQQPAPAPAPPPSPHPAPLSFLRGLAAGRANGPTSGGNGIMGDSLRRLWSRSQDPASERSIRNTSDAGSSGGPADGAAASADAPAAHSSASAVPKLALTSVAVPGSDEDTNASPLPSASRLPVGAARFEVPPFVPAEASSSTLNSIAAAPVPPQEAAAALVLPPPRISSGTGPVRHTRVHTAASTPASASAAAGGRRGPALYSSTTAPHPTRQHVAGGRHFASPSGEGADATALETAPQCPVDAASSASAGAVSAATPSRQQPPGAAAAGTVASASSPRRGGSSSAAAGVVRHTPQGPGGEGGASGVGPRPPSVVLAEVDAAAALARRRLGRHPRVSPWRRLMARLGLVTLTPAAGPGPPDRRSRSYLVDSS